MHPLLRREVLGILRTRRAFWLLVIAVALTGLLPIAEWPAAGSPGARPDSSGVVFVLFITQLTAALLVLPAFTAGAFAGERERGTHDLLFATPLRPSAIVLAKAAAPLACAGILLVAAAPPVCAVYLLGGVEFGSILKCYAVTFAALVSGTMVSLVQSVRARSTARAAVRGTVWIALWCTGPLILSALAIHGVLRVYSTIILNDWGAWKRERGFLALVEKTVDSWGRLFLLAFGIACAVVLSVAPLSILFAMGPVPFGMSPYTAIDLLLKPSSFFGSGEAPWIVYTLYALAVAAPYLIYLLRHADAPEAEDPWAAVPALPPAAAFALPEGRAAFGAAPPVASAPPTAAPAATRAGHRSLLTALLIRLGDWGVPLLRNPVFIREARTQFHGGVGYRQAVFWGSLAACLLVAAVGNRMAEPFRVAVAIVALVVPAAAATSIPREIEQGNLDFLRGTLLSAREIVTGKVLAAAASGLGVVAAPLLVVLPLVLASAAGAPESRHCAVATCVLLGATAWIAAVSSLASVVARRSLHALLLAYAVLGGLYLGLPIMCNALLPRAPMLLVATNPLLTLDRVHGGALRGTFGAGALELVFGFLAFQALTAAGLLLLACRRFERTLLRER